MKYQNITKDDMKNGDGLRVVLWVSGCEHRCPGCQNPVTWDADDGLDFDIYTLSEIYYELSKDYVSGLTISGGDPLYPRNYYTVINLCAWAKANFPEKTIWVYTGYEWEDIQRTINDCFFLKFIDVLVDGQFKQELADVNYPWAGSTNQRVIDVQKSLAKERVVLYESN